MEEIYRILLVDPDICLIGVLSQELSKEGYSVMGVQDGETVINVLGQQEFDMVIFELKLSQKITGFDLLKHIKKEKPSIKTIALTHHANLNNAIMVKKIGGDDFVSKPYDWFELLATIKQVIEEE
jgi:DNA-binding response OmpR family regulator